MEGTPTTTRGLAAANHRAPIVAKKAILRANVSMACLVACALSAALAASNARAVDGRAVAEQKGSMLIFPSIEIRWDDSGALLQDTFIELTNDHTEDVFVQMYFVNGDPPLEADYNPGGMLRERAHAGWNNIGVQILLTGNEPTYWSAHTGLPIGVAPWELLDPGDPPGRPNLYYENERTVRGFLVAWAVDAQGREIRWNHLSGTAVAIDYEQIAAWEYKPYAFQSRGSSNGMQPTSCEVLSAESGQCLDARIVSGRLDLDGFEYDSCPSALMFEFIAAGAGVPGRPDATAVVPVETMLTLMPCAVDLRQETDGPVTTKANFDIWNANEVRFSGTERCVTCWDSTPLDVYTYLGAANHFLIYNLQTDRGKARVRGLASQRCDAPGVVSEASALLGVSRKALYFSERTAYAGSPLSIQGLLGGRIQYDVIQPTSERLPKREGQP